MTQGRKKRTVSFCLVFLLMSTDLRIKLLESGANGGGSFLELCGKRSMGTSKSRRNGSVCQNRLSEN